MRVGITALYSSMLGASVRGVNQAAASGRFSSRMLNERIPLKRSTTIDFNLHLERGVKNHICRSKLSVGNFLYT